MAWLPPSATTTTALFHWGHRVCHANSEAPAATICRDNHSMPSWSPSPLLTSHAWMCQLLLQHNLNRPKFSVIDSMLIQLSTSWFRKITQSVKITHLPKCPCFQYMSQSSKVNVKGCRYYINFIPLNLRASCLMTKSCSLTCFYLEMQFQISFDILRVLLYQWSWKKDHKNDLIPVCWQRWAARPPWVPSPGRVWQARYKTRQDGPCYCCPPQI